MKKAIVLLFVALAIPTSVAFAKGPATHGKSNPRVMYVLKGTLSAYTAATSSTDGQISITVKHSNYHGRALRGQTLTFSTTAHTRVTFKHSTATTITDGAKGVLKFKAPRRMGAATDIATVLPTMAKALHIIDQARH
jgi:hypothetical protein